MEPDLYRTQHAIEEVVEKFERCDFGLEDFSHARHLTVACWYLWNSPPEVALVRMRAGLLRFIEHHGKQGYHETITRFWMELIGEFLGRGSAHDSMAHTISEVVARFGDKEVLFEYYTRELVRSERARREWIEPDLRSIAGARDRRARSGEGER